ncbi:MAG TPA: MmcQ/YjbR family DNA-binding protein [Candidatus Dormibacteraeota bacterium]|nr:MmcQ/YjbR family DNA-binding protein [Candidatus Dormibacteraeota bacterium]
MNIDEIRRYCLAFDGATENLQWGDDLCFKIEGKIFATLALTAVPQKMCFKCTPETFAELIEREDIRPAPYVGRYKWVLLDRLDALGGEELEDLIRRSYEMVAAKAPKQKIPGSTKKRSPKKGSTKKRLTKRRSTKTRSGTKRG